MSELEEGFAKLRRQFTELELEWSNAYDKLRQIVQRISKRAEIVERAAPEAQSEEGGEPGVPTSLSSRQQEANARILARRNRFPTERSQ